MIATLLLMNPEANWLQLAQRESERIVNTYRVEDGSMVRLKSGKPQPAFLWDFAVWMSAEALRTSRKSSSQTGFRELVSMAEAYYSAAGPVPGWSAVRSGNDRYYDDNAWLGLALLDAHERTRARSFLTLAEQVYQYVDSGWDEKLGGGIYWRESDKASKNSCSNAPSALLSLKLFRFTKQLKYRERAMETLEWLKRLEDPADMLYWDHQTLDGKIEKTKWTYSTALVIQAELEIFRQTKITRWRDQALRRLESGNRYWLTSTGAIRCDASFAHHWVDALIAAHRVDQKGPWLEIAKTATLRAMAAARRSDGEMGKRWEVSTDDEPILLFQASLARALWALAEATSPPVS